MSRKSFLSPIKIAVRHSQKRSSSDDSWDGADVEFHLLRITDRINLAINNVVAVVLSPHKAQLLFGGGYDVFRSEAEFLGQVFEGRRRAERPHADTVSARANVF